MLVVVILNAVSFLLIMGPSLSSMREFIALNVSNELAAAALIHAAFGSVAEIVGIYVVASWHLQPTVQKCIKRKKLMRLAFVLWVVALVFGIIVYRLLYM